MNCQEVQKVLLPFADGELGAEEAAAVRAALASCPECEAELAEIAAVRMWAREAFEADVADVELGGVFDGVMARLEGEGALRGAPVAPVGAPEPPGFVERVSTWMGELLRFERPMAAFAMAAAVAVLLAGVFLASSDAPSVLPTPGAGPSVAQQQPSVTHPRRDMEVEVVAGRNAASVESFEAADGKVVIDHQNDPDTPMVVWHIVDEGATTAPEKGL
ncbi:MAG: zf-HC2 domain-containing protein [Deltaproteobacteria bacterium]|nr:zf-HC2 domain-containing protein [Deltaproteobacteria bacterium]MCB9787164.1 zf-HC2 domain-containing protein [Deltaproteobacteria bacterium]